MKDSVFNKATPVTKQINGRNDIAMDLLKRMRDTQLPGKKGKQKTRWKEVVEDMETA